MFYNNNYLNLFYTQMEISFQRNALHLASLVADVLGGVIASLAAFIASVI